MPVTLDQTENIEIKTTSSQELTTVKVSTINIDVEGQIIAIRYNKGYMDGENFMAVSFGRGNITGDAFLAIAAGMADGNKSMYDNIKDAVYAQLIAQGDFAGTVS